VSDVDPRTDTLREFGGGVTLRLQCFFCNPAEPTVLPYGFRCCTKVISSAGISFTLASGFEYVPPVNLGALSLSEESGSTILLVLDVASLAWRIWVYLYLK